MMQRRLKNRLPPAVQACLKGLPVMVIVVTTTIFIPAEAWAKVQEGRGEPILVSEDGQQAGGVFIKHYSKNELNQKMPANPVEGLNQRLLNEVSGLLNRMAQGFSDSRKQASLKGFQTSEPTAKAFQEHFELLADSPETKQADLQGLKGFMQGEAQKAASDVAKTRIDLASKLGSGVKFDLSLRQLTGESAGAAAAKSGSIRYGLIIKDIKPDMDAPRQASINDTQDDLGHAGQAEVSWTIGPLDETSHRPIFENAGTDSGSPKSWKGLRIPSADFTGSIQPENLENFAKLSGDNPPTLRFDLKQSEDWYGLTYKSRLNGERLSVEHNLRIPVAGTVAFGRRFSDNWDVIQTSAYNVLYDKRLPLLSIHKMHIEQRVKADLAKTIGPHTIGVEARSEAEGVVSNESDRPEAYSVKYTREF